MNITPKNSLSRIVISFFKYFLQFKYFSLLWHLSFYNFSHIFNNNFYELLRFSGTD